MQPIHSILAVVDASPAAADAVTKAVTLARKFNARVKLFMCDAERGFVLSQSYVQAGVEEARKACVEQMRLHLDVLSQSAAAPDVQISLDAVCESPRYESIVQEVLRERPDLVIKNVGRASANRAAGLDETDWQLMRTCPATLLLTRGRPWQQGPHFAAAVDVSVAESAGLTRGILEAALLLVGGTGGSFDVLYAEPADLGDSERESGADALKRLVSLVAPLDPRVHVLVGRPEVSLPRFAQHRAYDVMLLGALTHKPAYTAQVGTLTSKLVAALDCDFILVKPTTYQCPLREAQLGSHTAA
jgi:universal stress protein E